MNLTVLYENKRTIRKTCIDKFNKWMVSEHQKTSVINAMKHFNAQRLKGLQITHQILFDSSKQKTNVELMIWSFNGVLNYFV